MQRFWVMIQFPAISVTSTGRPITQQLLDWLLYFILTSQDANTHSTLSLLMYTKDRSSTTISDGTTQAGHTISFGTPFNPFTHTNILKVKMVIFHQLFYIYSKLFISTFESFVQKAWSQQMCPTCYKIYHYKIIRRDVYVPRCSLYHYYLLSAQNKSDHFWPSYPIHKEIVLFFKMAIWSPSFYRIIPKFKRVQDITF